MTRVLLIYLNFDKMAVIQISNRNTYRQSYELYRKRKTLSSHLYIIKACKLVLQSDAFVSLVVIEFVSFISVTSHSFMKSRTWMA